MPAALVTAAWLVAMAPGIAQADCVDPFADPDDVVSFHLRMSRSDWWSVRFEDPPGETCDDQYPYFQVDFRCGEVEPWISIGVRRKRGDHRGRDTIEKPPLKLDFNRYVQGQRWPATRGRLGFRKLTLNNGQADMPEGALTALLTEHYAWRLMREEVPAASGVAYARLTVHFTDDGAEEYHGLYILIEDIDRTAIRGRFVTDRGRLVKTTIPDCRDRIVFDDGPNPTTDADAWLADNPADYDPADWRTLTEEVLQLGDLLRQEALRDVLNNVDDSVSGSYYNNYFAYDPPSGKRRYLPWDLDDLFRPFPQSEEYPLNTPLSETCSPVGARTRCLSELRERYLEIACQLINGTLAEEKLLAEFQHLDSLLRPLIAEEIEPVWTNSVVGKDPLDETTVGTYASEYERYTSWIPARIAFVREQINAAGVDCPDGCTSGESESCLHIDCPGERSCADGRWTTCIVPDEIPSNGLDDDCDGEIDEGSSTGEGGASGAAGAGAVAAGTGGSDTGPLVISQDEGGCGCAVPGRSSGRFWPLGVLPLALGLAWLRRFRRSQRAPSTSSP